MGQRLAKIMDLRDGEAGPALQAFLALFGIIAGHTILETARDALFLSKLPPSRLPLVYVLLAAATLVAAGWNARFVRRFGQRNALIFTLLTAAHGTTVLHFLPPTPALLFFLYVWSALIGTLLGVQFWMFAGQRFTVAQGKRLFGPIASGGVGGAVMGATSAAALLSIVPVGSLLLVSSGLFLITAVFLTTVPSATQEEAPSSSPRLGDVPLPAPRAEGMGALFRRYPYLRQMALLSVVSTAALLTTDYTFKLIASQRIPAEELGSFFARTYAVLNAVSLVVQLLLSGRILRQFGVLPALLILPFMLLGGAVGLFVTGGALLMALLTKGSDGSLRYSLHRVASELLWMPLPGEVRDRSKALLDSVLGRAVQAGMAGLLLLLAMLEIGTPRVLAAIVAALSLAWLVVAVTMRRSYLDLFRQALAKGATDLDAGAAELDLSAVEALLEALSSRDPPRVIAAMELLHEKKRSGLIPGLILYHESEEVLLRALAIAAESKRKAWLPLIGRLLAHDAEAVRALAVRALAAQGEREAVEPALRDPSPAVRARAAHALAGHGDDPLQDPTIAELFALEGEAGRAVKLALLEAIRDHEDARWASVVVRLSQEDDPEVVDQAVLSMGHLDDPRFIPILIERLALREGRASAREALVRQGDAAFEALDLALRDPATPQRLRVHLPRTLSRFRTQRAVDRLTDLLMREPRGFVRYKALRGLGRLVQVDPDAPSGSAQRPLKIDREKISAEMRRNLVEHLRLLSLHAPLEAREGVVLDARAEGSLSLVLGLLADKKKHALERAFRLLQIVHRHEDIRRTYDALRSESGRLRAQAMEFLDTLAVGRNRASAENRDGRELLRLVADDLPAAERVARAERFLRRPPSTYEEAVHALLADPDDLLATFAAYHALDLDSAALRDEVAALCLARPHLNIATPLAQTTPGATPRPPTELGLGAS